MGCYGSKLPRLEDEDDARPKYNERGLRITSPYKKYLGHKLEFYIMQASANLDHFTNAKDCITILRQSLEDGNTEGNYTFKEPLFKEMILRIGSVDLVQILDPSSGDRLFRTESLVKCGDCALTALGVLDRAENGVQWYAKELQRVNELFMGYIQRQPPLAWEKLFSGAFNLAIFLKYASFEDLDIAYKQIEKINLVDGVLPDKVARLLEHTKKIYFEPIISREQIAAIMADSSPSANAYSDILDILDKKGRQQTTEEGRLIYRLSIAWIRHFNRDSTTKFPVPPRNVQLINMLSIAEWIYQTTASFSSSSWAANILNFANMWSASNCRCLITQVGTGEGKRFGTFIILLPSRLRL